VSSLATVYLLGQLYGLVFAVGNLASPLLLGNLF
jgi:hypothetical protein